MTTNGATGVALVIDTLTHGGAEHVLMRIAGALDRERFRVHVILTREPGALASELAPDVVVHSLGRRTRLDVLALWRFADIVRRHDIRIVHSHNHSASYFVRLARTAARGSWIHVVHDHHGPVEGAPALQLLDRLLLHSVDYYFAVSARLAAYATRSIGIPQERCEHLPNGVVVPPLAQTPKPDRLTIVQVARLTPEKDPEMALAAAARLRRDVPEFRWLFAGAADTETGARCRAAAERMGLGNHVAFLGERDDIAAILRTAHIGVLTSRYEGLPLALLEYLAAGLPVVVTDVGDCGRLVRASGAGAVVAPGDVEGFCASLCRLAHEPAARRAAGEAGRAYVRAHHSVEAMTRRIATVYAALLEHHTREPEEQLSG